MAEILRALAKILLVQRISLGHHDQPVGVDIVDQRRQLQIDEPRAEALQGPAGGVEGGDIGGARRAVGAETGDRVALVEMADDADLHPVEARRQRRAVIRHRDIGRGRILRIVAGQGLHHDRAILDRAGQRPAMVERVAAAERRRAG